MELSEEQRERMRRNRERALELRKRRLEEEAKEREAKRQKTGNQETKIEHNELGMQEKEAKVSKNTEDEEEVELEAFEEGASEFVSKAEAMKQYCLPMGTLAVCTVVEKPNPRNSQWAPMKLYLRSEIRRRARARFDGLQGLVAERRKREEKRFENDLEKTKNIFK